MRWAAFVQRGHAGGERPVARTPLVAPGVVALYWGALIAASLTKGATWHLQVLWLYPLAGAAAIVYVGSPGRWAVRSIIIGALLPPLGSALLLFGFARGRANIADSDEIGPVIALAWLGASVAQIFVTALLSVVLDWMAGRMGFTRSDRDSRSGDVDRH